MQPRVVYKDSPQSRLGLSVEKFGSSAETREAIGFPSTITENVPSSILLFVNTYPVRDSPLPRLHRFDSASGMTSAFLPARFLREPSPYRGSRRIPEHHFPADTLVLWAESFRIVIEYRERVRSSGSGKIFLRPTPECIQIPCDAHSQACPSSSPYRETLRSTRRAGDIPCVPAERKTSAEVDANGCRNARNRIDKTLHVSLAGRVFSGTKSERVVDENFSAQSRIGKVGPKHERLCLAPHRKIIQSDESTRSFFGSQQPGNTEKCCNKGDGLEKFHVMRLSTSPKNAQ